MSVYHRLTICCEKDFFFFPSSLYNPQFIWHSSLFLVVLNQVCWDLCKDRQYVVREGFKILISEMQI